MLKGVIAANLLLSLSFPLNAQNNKEVSIKLKEGNLEQVLSEIQKQTGSHFFYDDAMAKMKLNNIDVSSLPLNKALDLILLKLGVTYKIEDNIVYLQKGNQKSKSTKNIKGVVIDEKGEPLMGVNVFVSGTQNGTVTDLDGNYQLSDVPSNGEISFSYIGYKQEALPVSKSDVLNATLHEDTKLLSDVVVTALGIKREKKVLGYSVQEVKSDDLTATGDASITSALQGKVAGLQINNASTGLGGSSKITIRGNSSLTDNNQPLWIVDGVPFNDNSSSGASLYGGIDRGSTSFDINPDDIESISVLKGPNAAALYGSRAGNGVILVTTKRGSSKKGFGVTYNGSLTWSKVGETLDRQTKYGQGAEGKYDPKSQYSWGSALDGSIQKAWNGEEYAYANQGNPMEDYFQSGFSQTHNVAIGAVKEDANFRTSFGFNDNQGIFKGENLKKYNVDFKGGMKMNKYLSMDAKISLSMADANNRPQYGKGGEVYQLLFIPNNIRLNDLKTFSSETSPHLNWHGPTTTIHNPYYVNHRYDNEDQRWRSFGYYNMKLELFDLLNFSAKYAFDYHRTKLVEKDRSDGIGDSYVTKDRLKKGEENFFEQNIELMVSGSKVFSDKYRFGYLAGSNFMYQNFEGLYAQVSNLLYKEYWTLQNVGSNGDRYPFEDFKEKRINSVFATAQFSYDDFVTLDVSARNDWSSTLPSNNRSYFYPAVNVSYLPTDMLNKMDISVPQWITFSKVRLSWAQVGKDTDPYQLLNYRSFGYQNGNTVVIQPTIRANADLKPEIATSYEAGLDMKFLNNRLGFDFTYYNNTTKNQVMDIDIAASSGFSKERINAGKIQNKGFEFMLYTTPVQTKDFDFNLDINLARNRSKILELHPTSKVYSLSNTSEEFIVKLIAREGRPMGEIVPQYVYKRNENGDIIIGENGLPYKEQNKTYETIGSIEPKLLMSVAPSFRYKNFSLSALIDMKFGGKIISMTEAVASQFGVAKRTEERGDIIVKGVKADGTPNTTPVSAQTYYSLISGEKAVAEEFMYDASFVKLKEIALTYNFSQRVLRNTPFNSLRLSLVGRNLCYLMKHTPGTSPEGGFDTSMFSQAIDFTAVPYTRTIGFSLNVGF